MVAGTLGKELRFGLSTGLFFNRVVKLDFALASAEPLGCRSFDDESVPRRQIEFALISVLESLRPLQAMQVGSHFTNWNVVIRVNVGGCENRNGTVAP